MTMRYYVTADVHGFYTELETALRQTGFFDDPLPHKLIVCGDLYDRGTEAKKLQEFILELLEKDQVILIRGNHEDLAESLLNNWHRGSFLLPHHNTNGTVDTVCQLTGFDSLALSLNSQDVGRAFLKDPYIQRIIPAMVDYFETEHYIFVHGWIPCVPVSLSASKMEYFPIPDWRTAHKSVWDKARWINGMEAAHHGMTEVGKTIVCGHWHCSFGHSRYENDGGEYDNDPNFSPYYGEGIIALDACTPRSRKVNCIVIDD